jgi:hypothetical protein
MIGSYFLPTQLLNSRRLGYPGGERQLTGSNIVLGRPGRCPHEPTLVTMIFDNSGSVSTGNDPIGNRYGEAKLAVEAIARRCRCHHELAAIVHFDHPTNRCVPPTPLDRHGLEMIQNGLSIPTDGRGISVLGPSLAKAYQLAAQYPDHRRALLVATDFELFDRDLSGELEALGSYPGIVHALVLRAEPPTEIDDDDRVIVTRVNYDAEPGAVAKALFAALTSYRKE